MKAVTLLFSFLFLFVFSKGQMIKPADELLAAAYKEATASNKKVMIIFHASWCGWCHKMDSSLNDVSCKKYFDKNYVIVHLTVEEDDKHKATETPGAAEVLIKYHGEKSGLPFWVVADKDGTLLADSELRKDGATLDTPGDNMGCPSEDGEVAAFIKILKNTSALTDAELEIVATRFKKNKS